MSIIIKVFKLVVLSLLFLVLCPSLVYGEGIGNEIVSTAAQARGLVLVQFGYFGILLVVLAWLGALFAGGMSSFKLVISFLVLSLVSFSLSGTVSVLYGSKPVALWNDFAFLMLKNKVIDLFFLALMLSTLVLYVALIRKYYRRKARKRRKA